MKPVIGITMGDAAGIGPELILKTLNDKEVFKKCTPVIIGNYKLLSKLYLILKDKKLLSDMNLVMVDSYEKLKSCIDSDNSDILVFDDFGIDLSDIKIGRVNAVCGKASILYISRVADLIGKGIIDGTCSAPQTKKQLTWQVFTSTGKQNI